MPWLEKQKAGGWSVRWWTAGRGSAKGRSGPFPNRPAAEVEAKRIAREVAATQPLRTHQRIGWDELVTRYVASIATTTAAHQEQMARTARRAAEQHRWATAGDVTPLQVVALGAYHRRCVRAVLRFAILADQQVDPRCLMVRQSRRNGPRKDDRPLLTDAQVGDLIARATKWSPAEGALAHLIAVYGVRSQSLVGLSCGALVAGELRILVKSGDGLRLRLRADTMAILAPLAGGRAPDAPLFVGHLGVPWASGQTFSAWWGHCVATGPGQGILDLRRYATTRQMATSGQNARAVADAQGRRTVRLVSQIYQRSTQPERDGIFANLPPVPHGAPPSGNGTT